jgi:hypothetical protein
MKKVALALALWGTFAFAQEAGTEVGKKQAEKLFRKFEKLMTSKEATEYQKRDYVFDPNVLAAVTKRAAGLPTAEALDQVQRELIALYGAHIVPTRHWIYNAAGAVLGEITLMHCSPKEYVIFFGSPVQAQGFSGRYHHMEFYDFMLTGEMQTYTEGDLTAQVYKPGEYAHMVRGQSKGFHISGPSFMLEYGRGSTVTAFPFGVIAPARYVTLDFHSAWGQIKDCAKLAIHEIFGKNSHRLKEWE